MKPLTLVLVAVVSAGIGLAIGRMVGDGAADYVTPDPDGGSRLKVEEEAARSLDHIRTLEAEIQSLEVEAERLGEENQVLEGKLAAAERYAAGDVPAEETTAAAPTAVPGGFFMDRYEGAMKKVDWKSVGSSMGEMSQLIKAILPDIARGEAPDMSKVGKIQKLNSNLVAAAVLVQQDVPGNGINGAFSNPAFMVNAMASTLQAVEKPLTERQRKLIETIAADWLAADEKRRKAYDDSTWMVRRLYEEAELKDGFFRDAFAVMTPEQVEALSPEDARSRVRLDLFSSSLIYVQRVRPVPFEDTDEVIDFFVNQGLAGFRMNDAEKAQAKEMVTEWLDGVPTNLLFRETNTLDLEGMIESDRVTAWAKLEADMVKRLSETIPFDEKRSNLARQVGGVAVPLKRETSAD